MKGLLDHCVPRRFARELNPPGAPSRHDVATARAMGWERPRNGDLLAAAAGAGFEAFITVDRNLSYQQNAGDLPLAVIAIIAPDNTPPTPAASAPEVLRVLASGPARRLHTVGRSAGR